MKYPELKTVAAVDINRYAGKWFEIATFPQRFENGCNCSTAEYTPTDKGYIIVYNQCRRGSAQGKITGIKGKAFPVKGSNNSKLKVRFYWPFRGDYWIIELADDYSYAVVGTENRKYLWVLSRTPKMEKNLLESILKRTKDKAFNIQRLRFTNQDCADK